MWRACFAMSQIGASLKLETNAVRRRNPTSEYCPSRVLLAARLRDHDFHDMSACAAWVPGGSSTAPHATRSSSRGGAFSSNHRQRRRRQASQIHAQQRDDDAELDIVERFVGKLFGRQALDDPTPGGLKRLSGDVSSQPSANELSLSACAAAKATAHRGLQHWSFSANLIASSRSTLLAGCQGTLPGRHR